MLLGFDFRPKVLGEHVLLWNFVRKNLASKISTSTDRSLAVQGIIFMVLAISILVGCIVIKVMGWGENSILQKQHQSHQNHQNHPSSTKHPNQTTKSTSNHPSHEKIEIIIELAYYNRRRPGRVQHPSSGKTMMVEKK